MSESGLLKVAFGSAAAVATMSALRSLAADGRLGPDHECVGGPRMLIRGAWLCLGRQSSQQARNFGLKLEA